jgi:DNA-binding MarR family transcriptional regulator
LQELRLNTIRPPKGLTPSICEEALESFSKSEDSLAELIEENHIEVRDFMILSFVCDQNELTVDQLTRVLGMSRSTIVHCVERLQGAGLIHYGQAGETAEASDRVAPTAPGRDITERILTED